MPTNLRIALVALVLQAGCAATVLQSLPTAAFEETPHTSGLRVRLDGVHVHSHNPDSPNVVFEGRLGLYNLKVDVEPTPETWMEHAVLQELAAAGLETTEDAEAPGLTVDVYDFSLRVISRATRTQPMIVGASPRVECALHYPATDKLLTRAFGSGGETFVDSDLRLGIQTNHLARDTHAVLAEMSAFVALGPSICAIPSNSRCSSLMPRAHTTPALWLTPRLISTRFTRPFNHPKCRQMTSSFSAA